MGVVLKQIFKYSRNYKLKNLTKHKLFNRKSFIHFIDPKISPIYGGGCKISSRIQLLLFLSKHKTCGYFSLLLVLQGGHQSGNSAVLIFFWQGKVS
jgi:hypothetical protein